MSFAELFNQAQAFAVVNDFANALPLYRRALTLNRGFPKLYNDMGVALYHMGEKAEAIESYKTAIYLAPKEGLAYANLGVALNHEGRHGEALAYFNQAARLDPKLTIAYHNLGDSYAKLSMFDEAEAALERALRLDPTNGQTLTNMGVVQWGQGRVMAAIDAFKEAIRRDADNAVAHKNLGLVELLRGNYGAGWDEYEWRDRADKFTRKFDWLPRWDGKSTNLLGISKEQGVGDQILHASMLDELPAPYIMEVDRRLKPLFERSFPAGYFFCDESTPVVREQMPIASLGGVFRRSADKFPGTPYLVADQDKVCDYRARMAPDKFKIGMSWASVGTEFAADKFVQLGAWAPLFAQTNTQFIDLQYAAGEQDRLGFPITHFDDVDAFGDLDSLAALIMACDMIITISNTTAHLAAALGKPTWVLVPNGYGKFWYWGDRGDTTPWYKAVRLFRRGKSEGWEPVMVRVSEALQRLAPAASPDQVPAPECSSAPQ